PQANPGDVISVASWPSNSSLWNPALNFAGSYGLSSTRASALSMNRFCSRSYSRPTMLESPTLRPEYEYDPSANPVSLKPASVVSTWFAAAGGGSPVFAAVSAGPGGALWAASHTGARNRALTRRIRLSLSSAREGMNRQLATPSALWHGLLERSPLYLVRSDRSDCGRVHLAGPDSD